ncbi:MAG: DUF4340 domain-containing protein [Chloroflexi bacterium]|nr:DUF4340 domain-containing protein [Chloroflexota bacterium]
MNSRVTLIVVAVFIALFGFVFLVDQDKPSQQLNATPTATGIAKPYLFPVASSDVQSIEVRDLRAPRQVKVTRTDAGWRIETPEQKEGDDFKITQMLNRLITLQPSRVLSNVTDLKSFGFITATLEARITLTNTEQYALTVGDKTTGGNDYYAVHTGGKIVFIVSQSVIDDLMAWFDAPPYQPTPTPTFTPTIPVTPTVTGTPPTSTPAPITPTTAPPNIVPTFVPAPTNTPRP